MNSPRMGKGGGQAGNATQAAWSENITAGGVRFIMGDCHPTPICQRG